MNDDKPWRAWVYKAAKDGALKWVWDADVLEVDETDKTKCNVTIEGDTWVAAYFVEDEDLP